MYLWIFCFVFFIQIKQEFRRITNIPLEQTFMHKLDEYAPKLVRLMKDKGGVVGLKMRWLLDRPSQVCLFGLFICFTGRWAYFFSHSQTRTHHKPHFTRTLHVLQTQKQTYAFLCFHSTVHCVRIMLMFMFLICSQKQSIEMRRETVIRSLILYLGEKQEELFEGCLV